MIPFGPEQREHLRTLIRAAPLDERIAADEAERLARAWTAALPETPSGVDLAGVLSCKAAGYNADLHAHARRVLKAIAGCDAFLAGRREVRFDLPDLLLGEYVLWRRLAAIGGRFETGGRDEALERTFEQGLTPRSRTPGFEPVEVSLDPAAPGRGLGLRGGPIGTLFVASMNNYLNPMLPVMERLVARGAAVAVLTPAVAASWSNIAGLPAGVERLTLEDLFDGPPAADLARWAATSRERDRDGWPMLRDRFDLHGVDLWPLVAADITHLARVYLPYAAGLHRLAANLALARGVGRVVVARLRRATECGIAGALRASGSPADMLIHGHISARPDRRFVDGSFTGVDRVLAWSRRQGAALVAKDEGVEPERVVVTGNPEWDALIRRAAGGEATRSLARARVGAALKLPTDLPWLVFTTQEQSRPLTGELAQRVAGRCALIVKTHPAEDAAAYRSMVPEACGANVRIVTGAPPSLHEMLHAADLTLTFHSTTNIESLLLGTPVASLAMGPLAGEDRLVALEEFGLPVLEHAAHLDGLIGTLAADPRAFRVASSPAVERAVAALSQGRTGPATDCVAALLCPTGAAVA